MEDSQTRKPGRPRNQKDIIVNLRNGETFVFDLHDFAEQTEISMTNIYNVLVYRKCLPVRLYAYGIESVEFEGDLIDYVPAKDKLWTKHLNPTTK